MYNRRGINRRDLPQPPHLLIQQNPVQYTQQMENIMLTNQGQFTNPQIVRYQRMLCQSQEIYYMMSTPRRSSLSNHPSACRTLSQRQMMNQRMESNLNISPLNSCQYYQQPVQNNFITENRFQSNENVQQSLPVGRFDRMTQEYILKNGSVHALNNGLYERVMNDRMETAASKQLLDQHQNQRAGLMDIINDNMAQISRRHNNQNCRNRTINGLGDHTYSRNIRPSDCLDDHSYSQQSSRLFQENENRFAPSYITDCQNANISQRLGMPNADPSNKRMSDQTFSPWRPSVNGRMNSELVEHSVLLQSALKDIHSKVVDCNTKKIRKAESAFTKQQNKEHAKWSKHQIIVKKGDENKEVKSPDDVNKRNPLPRTASGKKDQVIEKNNETVANVICKDINSITDMNDAVECSQDNCKQDSEKLNSKNSGSSNRNSSANAKLGRGLLHDHKDVDCNVVLDEVQNINPECPAKDDSCFQDFPKRTCETKERSTFVEVLADVVKTMFNLRKHEEENKICRATGKNIEDLNTKVGPEHCCVDTKHTSNTKVLENSSESRDKTSCNRSSGITVSSEKESNVALKNGNQSRSRTTSRNIFQCILESENNMCSQDDSKYDKEREDCTKEAELTDVITDMVEASSNSDDFRPENTVVKTMEKSNASKSNAEGISSVIVDHEAVKCINKLSDMNSKINKYDDKIETIEVNRFLVDKKNTLTGSCEDNDNYSCKTLSLKSDHDFCVSETPPDQSSKSPFVENDFSFLELGYCPIALPLGCHIYEEDPSKDENNNEIQEYTEKVYVNKHMQKLCDDKYNKDKTEILRPWIIRYLDKIPKPTVWKTFMEKMDIEIENSCEKLDHIVLEKTIASPELNNSCNFGDISLFSEVIGSPVPIPLEDLSVNKSFSSDVRENNDMLSESEKFKGFQNDTIKNFNNVFRTDISGSDKSQKEATHNNCNSLASKEAEYKVLMAENIENLEVVQQATLKTMEEQKGYNGNESTEEIIKTWQSNEDNCSGKIEQTDDIQHNIQEHETIGHAESTKQQTHSKNNTGNCLSHEIKDNKLVSSVTSRDDQNNMISSKNAGKLELTKTVNESKTYPNDETGSVKEKEISNKEKRFKRKGSTDAKLLQEAMNFLCSGKIFNNNQSVIDCFMKNHITTRQSSTRKDLPVVKRKRGRPAKVKKLKEKQKIILEDLKSEKKRRYGKVFSEVNQSSLLVSHSASHDLTKNDVNRKTESKNKPDLRGFTRQNSMLLRGDKITDLDQKLRFLNENNKGTDDESLKRPFISKAESEAVSVLLTLGNSHLNSTETKTIEHSDSLNMQTQYTLDAPSSVNQQDEITQILKTTKRDAVSNIHHDEATQTQYTSDAYMFSNPYDEVTQTLGIAESISKANSCCEITHTPDKADGHTISSNPHNKATQYTSDDDCMPDNPCDEVTHTCSPTDTNTMLSNPCNEVTKATCNANTVLSKSCGDVSEFPHTADIDTMSSNACDEISEVLFTAVKDPMSNIPDDEVTSDTEINFKMNDPNNANTNGRILKGLQTDNTLNERIQKSDKASDIISTVADQDSSSNTSTAVTRQENSVSSIISTAVTDQYSSVSSNTSTAFTHQENSVSGIISTVVTDQDSSVSGNTSTAVTRQVNSVSGIISTAVIDQDSSVSGNTSTAVTSRDNSVSGITSIAVTDQDSSVSGYTSTTVTDQDSSVSGNTFPAVTCQENSLSRIISTVLTDQDSSVCGITSTVTHQDSSVCGNTSIVTGLESLVSSNTSTAVPCQESVSGNISTVVTDQDSSISGYISTVVTDQDNLVSGNISTAVTGQENCVLGFANGDQCPGNENNDISREQSSSTGSSTEEDNDHAGIIPNVDKPCFKESSSGKWLIPILERLNIDISKGRVIVTRSAEKLSVNKHYYFHGSYSTPQCTQKWNSETLEKISPNISEENISNNDILKSSSKLKGKRKQKCLAESAVSLRSTGLSTNRISKKCKIDESENMSPRITRNRSAKNLKGNGLNNIKISASFDKSKRKENNKLKVKMHDRGKSSIHDVRKRSKFGKNTVALNISNSSENKKYSESSAEEKSNSLKNGTPKAAKRKLEFDELKLKSRIDTEKENFNAADNVKLNDSKKKKIAKAGKKDLPYLSEITNNSSEETETIHSNDTPKQMMKKSCAKSIKKLSVPKPKSMKSISASKVRKTSKIKKMSGPDKVKFRVITEPAEQKILRLNADALKKLNAVKSCGYCHVTVSSTKYKYHVKMNHPYRCARCGLLFSSKKEKHDHWKEKHNTERYHCITCNKIFDLKFHYEMHVKSSGHRYIRDVFKRAVTLMENCLGLQVGSVEHGQKMISDGNESTEVQSVVPVDQTDYLFCNTEDIPFSHHEPEVQNLLNKLSNVKSCMLTFPQKSSNFSFGQFMSMQNSQASVCGYSDVTAQMSENYMNSSTTFYTNENTQYGNFAPNTFERDVPVISQNSLAIENESSSSSSTMDLDQPTLRACLQDTNLSDLLIKSNTYPTSGLFEDVFQLLEEDGYLGNDQLRSVAFEGNDVCKRLDKNLDNDIANIQIGLNRIQDICHKNTDSRENYSLFDLTSQRSISATFIPPNFSQINSSHGHDPYNSVETEGNQCRENGTNNSYCPVSTRENLCTINATNEPYNSVSTGESQCTRNGTIEPCIASGNNSASGNHSAGNGIQDSCNSASGNDSAGNGIQDSYNSVSGKLYTGNGPYSSTSGNEFSEIGRNEQAVISLEEQSKIQADYNAILQDIADSEANGQKDC